MKILYQKKTIAISGIKSLLVLILGLTILSCNNKTKLASIQKSNSTIKFIIGNEIGVENIIFTEFGGFEKEDVKVFSPNMEMILNEPLDGFYQLLLQKGEKYIQSQIWLKGNEITIRGNIVDNQLQIDTVINSPFYYYTIDVLNNHSTQNRKNQSQEEANKSLLVDIKNNLDNPFSNHLSSIYINRNIDDPKKLKELHQILSTQSDLIKGHFISVHENLEKMVNVDKIDLEKFEFNDVNGNSIKLPINRDSIYMLDFWFTGCLPCIKDHESLKTNLQIFRKSGVDIIGISTDYDQTVWINFINKKSYMWKNFIETNDDDLSDILGINSFPTYLLIKGSGEIINRSNSLEESISFIEKNDLREN